MQQYRDKIITEAERPEKLQIILRDYQEDNSHMDFPEALKDNLHAQAFYGVVGAILTDELTHFIYPNHSKAFYEFLSVVMPDWKERKKMLETVE